MAVKTVGDPSDAKTFAAAVDAIGAVKDGAP
jgi:hypothetical protein